MFDDDDDDGPDAVDNEFGAPPAFTEDDWIMIADSNPDAMRDDPSFRTMVDPFGDGGDWDFW